MARAIESADGDREVVALRNEVQALQEVLEAAARKGEEPPEAEMERLQTALGRLQASSVYQSVVAAQANFDRVMYRVDAALQEGMRRGAESRIIVTS
ncbi:MAG: YlbF family regulator [Gemmatimonadota bacterium]|nr:YlbF family regulator [Gemmatimonadota bacterium]MDE2872281.1 YlbF family regulator [Gemmatimonadota bacterium]